MKKKSLLVLLLSVGLLLLVGCGKEKEESFEVSLNEVNITPGTKLNADTINEEYDYSEVPDCAFGGKGIVYTFNDVEISTKEDGTIYSVYYLNANAKTKEGLSISDEVSRIKELYGDPDKNENNQMIYKKGKVQLVIDLSNNYVGGIEYLLAEE